MKKMKKKKKLWETEYKQKEWMNIKVKWIGETHVATTGKDYLKIERKNKKQKKKEHNMRQQAVNYSKNKKDR